MSHSDRTANHRMAFGVGTAAVAAFSAGLISLGSAPVALADDDPFEDLFGSTGLNAWTVGLDSALPTQLASFLDQAVVSFQLLDADPVSDLIGAIDSSAFVGGFPDDFLGDLAVGLDYTLAPLGLGIVLDPVIDGLLGSFVTG